MSEFLHPAIVLAQASVTGASMSATTVSQANLIPYISGYQIQVLPHAGATVAPFKVSTAGWGDTDFTIGIFTSSLPPGVIISQNFTNPIRGKTPGGTVALNAPSPGASVELHMQIFGWLAP